MSRKIVLGLLAGAVLGQSASAQEQASYRAELLADVEGRSSLQGAPANVVFNNGHFGFESPDGTSSLNFFAYGAYRHLFNFRDTDEGGDGGEGGNGDDDDNDFTHGGQLTRVRIGFFGNVGSENMFYFIQLGADGLGDGDFGDFSVFGESSGGSVVVLDFLGQYFFGDAGQGRPYVIFGQGRPLQSFEGNTAPQHFQALERSIPFEIFGSDRQQFFGVGFEGEQLSAEVFFSDGIRTAGTDFISSAEADASVGARVNYVIIGTTDNFQDRYGLGTVGQNALGADSPRALRVGGGVQFQVGGETGINTADVDVILAQGGVEFREGGLTANGEFYYLYVDPNQDGVDETNHFGVVVGVGFFFNPTTEAYARYEAVFFDEDLELEEDDVHFGRIGVNHYPFGTYAVRLTGEFIVAFTDTDSLGEVASFLSDAGLGTGSLTRQNIIGGSDDSEFGFGFQAAIFQ